MTITTRAIWTMPIAQQIIDDSKVKVEQMQADGQTDGVPVITYDSPAAGEETVDRTWIDTAAAEEWMNFLVPYGPISIEIIL